nr:reverse transcriptase domain-containing protein [Tanacetum cinerariifolium]
MDAMTIKMDAQYKELQSRTKQSTPDLDDDDIPMSREEAKFMQTFRKTHFYNDYRDQDSNHDNWRSNERNDYNRDNYRSNIDDKPYDLQKQFNYFMKSQQSTNAFVKETFMDLKTQLETVAKNHQASIQNLKTKFDRLANKQSGRPSRSLPSNTQPNPRGGKAYQPLQARNEHVNFIFTRSGKSYNPPYNPNDQQKETPVNFDSDDEDNEPTPQPKTQPTKSVKETSLPKPYKPKNSINEILEEDFDALLDEGSKILHSIEGTLLEEEIFSEFDEFMAMTGDENFDFESDTKEPPFEKITINTDYKIKTSLEEPPADLELKPLPDNLEYVFLEEPSFLPVIISSWLSKEKKNKLVSRVCIDYHKLNEAIAKDHFPLPFRDQMLERLAGNKYFCFLDGFSGYFQIPIDPNDQEKTTFTCTFGTRAYRRMPFGLCNAPATFQRCMVAIFHDMIKESVEVFMVDFSVFEKSFETCLNNLDKMLQRCKDTHLVLNWKKCHFMVKEGIVLGHKVSSAGLEVDK